MASSRSSDAVAPHAGLDAGRWRRAALLLAVAVVSAFALQGSRGLWESTEGRYAEVAREMIETGDWLVPRLDYQPHWTKPPLAYWVIAGGMALAGENEWGARLGNAVAMVVLVLAVGQLGTALWDSTTGLVAGLIYATSPFAVAGANSLSTDLVLALWTLLVVLAYWKACGRLGEPAERRWIVLLWLFAGLGFLTKGPPSLLVLLAVVVYHVASKRRGRRLPRLLSPVGLLVFAVVGLGWYVWAVATHPGLLAYFLGTEVVHRIASEDFHRHPEWYVPFAMYLPLMLLGPGLWVLFWPAVAWKHRAVLRPKALAGLLGRNDRALFLLLWVALPLVILSVVKSRMPLYVLPLLPAVVLALARGLVRLFEGRRLWRACAVVAAAALGLAVVAKGVMAYAPSERDERPLAKACRPLMVGDTRFLLYNRDEKYGLQFYLAGRMERVSRTPGEPSAPRHLAQVVEDLKNRPGRTGYVFVVRHDVAAEVRQALDGAGVPYAGRSATDRYDLLVISADAPKSGPPTKQD